MRIVSNHWLRGLLLIAVYLLGLFGIMGSVGSGSGSGSESSGSGFECDLEVKSIDPTTDSSGDIYVIAVVYTRSDDETTVARLNSNGSTDLGFESFTPSDSRVIKTLALANDGSGDIYVGGTSFITRFNSDGTQDADFSAGISDTLTISTTLDGSGDIYVGREFNSLVRLNSDGSVDPGFTIAPGFNYAVVEVEPAMDGSGDIYVAGYRSFDTNLVRLNSDGSIDTDFVSSIKPNAYEGIDNILAMATDGTGDIFVQTTTYLRDIARLNSDGSGDAGFSIGSGFENFGSTSIAPAADGTGAIYVGGDFHLYNGDFNRDFVRLNSDGSKDFNFITGSGFADPRPRFFGPAASSVISIARATDGTTDVFVGGNFTDYNGSTLNGLTRLNDNGALEKSFAVRLAYRGKICSNKTLIDW